MSEKIINGINLFSHKPIQITYSSEGILEVNDLEYHEDDNIHSLKNMSLPYIAPGLVDLQINGFQGIDFNGYKLTVGDVIHATYRLLSIGVTSFYPTIITNSNENIDRLLQTITKACETSSLVSQCIKGIHLEGPFISPVDGARGAHALQYVKAPDWEIFCRWQQISADRIRIITLSPEWEQSPAFIEKCVASGVVVAIGHTTANTEQIKLAVRAGARLSTHLGNGAQANIPRHPNYIWDQLAEEQLSISVIADGHHLPYNVLKIFQHVKQQHMILVSDAVALCGMPAGDYEAPIGGKVTLTEQGRLYLTNQPQLLAGSACSLLDAVHYVERSGLNHLSDAWQMASTRPAQLMGLDSAAGIMVGAPADMVIFHWEQQTCTKLKVIKSGNIIN